MVSECWINFEVHNEDLVLLFGSGCFAHFKIVYTFNGALHMCFELAMQVWALSGDLNGN